MRVLAIDYGDRHVGLALSDILGITAQPLETYRLTGHEGADRKFFQDLVARHEVGEIVIGDPLRMDGTSGTRAEKTRRFAEWLKKAVQRPITFIDERLTTQEALHLLGDDLRGPKKKAWEDRIAAVIILSTYLERRRGEAHGPGND